MLLRALLLLLLTAFAAWPAWSLPDLDGTEGRRVQIALEMAQGDWLVPTIGHVPTWAKPPLHYWLLAVASQWFGNDVIALRLPGVLAAFVAALIAGELLRRSFDSSTGWIGALAIATSPIVVFEWPSAEIDPVFATCTAMSLWCLAVGTAGARRGLLVVAGVLGGLAVLAKGPPYLVFALGAWLVWCRHRRLRGLFTYLIPLCVVVLVCYVPIWLWRIGPGEMLAVAGEESVGRLSFLGWHSLRSIPEFWLRAFAVQLPFVLWCFWEWRGARDARMDARDLTLRMCSGAAVLSVVVLTFFPGRPTRYILPNALLFTFAVAPAVAHFARFPGPLPVFARRIVGVLGVAGAVALCVLPFVPPPAGAGALGLAAILAVAPLLVRTPAALVTGCLLLPVVAAWTVGLDRTRTWLEGPRARRPAASVLLRELAQRDALADLQTVGHFDSPLLLALGLQAPGDESASRPWRAHWVLHEIGTHPEVHAPPHYTTRLRLDLPFKSFALCERTAEPR